MADGVPKRYAEFEPALHAAASRGTGLADFGRDDYREGLARVLAACEADLPDDEATRAKVFAFMLPGLVGRLHSEAGWRRHPDCLADPIVRPLVIAGIPRTGTTALHQLLALDPRFQGLESWLIPNPILRPPRGEWLDHPLYRAAAAAARALEAAAPRAVALHRIGPDDVDECLALMMQTFVTNQLPSLLELPTYDDWYLAQDELGSYRRLADNLRLIGHAEREKTWLLKNPTHFLRTGSLLEVFPDACVILTHRDPVATLVSLSSLLAAYRGDPAPGSPEARRIGPRQLRVYAQATAHTRAVRARRPDAFHDVQQEELARDPLGVVRGVYARFDLELGPETETRMQTWIAAQSKRDALLAHGRRGETPADYGLDPEEVREKLA
ncbi:MAG: sulfotransferase [Myxococcota bacterium]